MGIPDHIIYLLRNMYAGQEGRVITVQGTMSWLKIGKGICQGCILSPRLFNLYAEYIMGNARMDEAQAGIKTAGMKKKKRLQGEVPITSHMQMTLPLWQKVKRN